jgi:hypothetical protein
VDPQIRRRRQTFSVVVLVQRLRQDKLPLQLPQRQRHHRLIPSSVEGSVYPSLPIRVPLLPSLRDLVVSALLCVTPVFDSSISTQSSASLLQVINLTCLSLVSHHLCVGSTPVAGGGLLGAKPTDSTTPSTTNTSASSNNLFGGGNIFGKPAATSTPSATSATSPAGGKSHTPIPHVTHAALQQHHQVVYSQT